MITQEEANYLIGLKKYVIEDGNLLEKFNFSPSIPIESRIYLAAEAEEDFSFFIEITQSAKRLLKLTLHFQEEAASIGLLRVDFNGRHRNPENMNDKVPELFRDFAGQWIEESHIHYYVEGYKPLVWAIPLNIDDSFFVKKFEDIGELGNIVSEFGRRVNLITKISTTFQMVLL
ncbi:MAG: hypothetical protein L6Q29_03340 [Candidatus Pacebacteria bacterium]|nr:hypothetical protein [Candidatus Paceibacterota bacterium]